MVQIQINLSNSLSKYIGIQKEIYGVKTKSAAIVRILEDNLKDDKRLMKKLESKSKEV